jgi:hypothetical protein
MSVAVGNASLKRCCRTPQVQLPAAYLKKLTGILRDLETYVSGQFTSIINYAAARQRTSRTSEPRRGPTWARTGDPIQLSRVLNLLQEPNVVSGQAVRSSALPQ